MTVTLLAPYRELPAISGPSFLPVSFLGRLPLTMAPVGILTFAVAQTGSFASAGLAATATAAGTAIGAPLSGALADRHGQRPVLGAAVLMSTLSLLTLALWPSFAPLTEPVLLALCAVAGFSLPQVGGMARARWLALTHGDAGTAMAFEGTADELAYVLGPALSGILAAAFGAPAALVAAALAALFAAGAFAAHPTHRVAAGRRTPAVVARAGDPGRTPAVVARPGDPGRTRAVVPHSGEPGRTPAVVARAGEPGRTPVVVARAGDPGRTRAVVPHSGEPGRTPVVVARPGDPGSLRVGLLRALAVPVPAMICMGAFFASCQSAVTAYAATLGRPAAGGLIYALMAVGSAVTALGTALLPPRFTSSARVLVCAAGLFAGVLALAFAPGPASFCLAMLLTGLFVGPLLVTLNQVVGERVPLDRSASAMAGLSAGGVTGIAAGATVAGALAEAHGAVGALVPAGIAALALVAAAAGLRQSS